MTQLCSNLYFHTNHKNTVETHAGDHAGAVHHGNQADAAPQAVKQSWPASEGTGGAVLAAHEAEDIVLPPNDWGRCSGSR